MARSGERVEVAARVGALGRAPGDDLRVVSLLEPLVVVRDLNAVACVHDQAGALRRGGPAMAEATAGGGGRRRGGPARGEDSGGDKGQGEGQRKAARARLARAPACGMTECEGRLLPGVGHHHREGELHCVFCERGWESDAVEGEGAGRPRRRRRAFGGATGRAAQARRPRPSQPHRGDRAMPVGHGAPRAAVQRPATQAAAATGIEQVRRGRP